LSDKSNLRLIDIASTFVLSFGREPLLQEVNAQHFQRTDRRLHARLRLDDRARGVTALVTNTKSR
jgi:hypothetical protein